jgi:hypothetical protein
LSAESRNRSLDLNIAGVFPEFVKRAALIYRALSQPAPGAFEKERARARGRSSQ